MERHVTTVHNQIDSLLSCKVVGLSVLLTVPKRRVSFAVL